MGRRLLDIFASAFGLLILALPLGIILLLVWCQDRNSPFYIADRAGIGGKPFRMVKIRSMIVHADKNGVESTSVSDNRITPLGHFIRRWKVDELSQLWNVLKGDMSLVGPRPNTMNEVATYADWEKELLMVRPGITDFSSIIFSDEGEILKGSADPDGDYTRLIRPWKGQFGLIYANNPSLKLNVQIIFLTILAIFDKETSLAKLEKLLIQYNVNDTLRLVSSRKQPLKDFNIGAQ
jgi:lipopolysaccharide/colanic/teichoic acid biosynthesis glycosyltransferase